MAPNNNVKKLTNHPGYRLRVGGSKPYLAQIETGKRQGTVETLSAIARALDIPLDVFTD